jgi:hypothetical protein
MRYARTKLLQRQYLQTTLGHIYTGRRPKSAWKGVKGRLAAVARLNRASALGPSQKPQVGLGPAHKAA